MVSNLLISFKESILTNGLVERGDKIILAVSGGLDSVVLLHLFLKIKSEWNLKLVICHINHNLRGAEANRDQLFVEKLAENRHIVLHTQSVDVLTFAKANKMGIEEAARILRYRALDALRTKLAYHKIATGHTADDQVETVLDHFLRGSGLRGLQGMEECRGNYIRPLLEFSRMQLSKYAVQNKISHIEDTSNNNLDFKRNRIRHELIPHLETAFNPNIRQMILRTSEIFSEAENYFQKKADEIFESLVFFQNKNEIVLDIKSFLGYFKVLKKYTLIKAFQELKIDRNSLNFIAFQRILTLIENQKIGKRIQINTDFEVLVDHDGLVVHKVQNQTPQKTEFSLSQKGREVTYNDYLFSWNVSKKSEIAKYKQNPNIEFFDAGKLSKQLVLRSFNSGDHFKPINFSGEKKISKYFSDKKVPLRKRKRIPILKSDNRVAWVCGYCLDDAYKVTSITEHVLKFELMERTNGI